MLEWTHPHSVASQLCTVKEVPKRAFNIDNSANPLKRKQLALITALFCPYMEPLCCVSRGKTGQADTGRPWCCTPSLPLVLSSRAWCAHCRRCSPVSRMLTYWQRARGPTPPVAAHRLTSLLCCQGMQAPSERPHVLAWYLLFSEGMYAQVVEEPLACAPSWTV